MFKFEYTDTESGIYNTMELRHDGLTHDEVADHFTDFLRGCSYVFDSYARLRLVGDDGVPLPSFEEKYGTLMANLQKRYEDDYDPTIGEFPVI